MTTVHVETRKTYSYGEDFQLGVLALLAQDPGFRNNYEDVVDPSYFDTDVLQALARMMLSIHRANKTLSFQSIDAEIVDYCKKYEAKDEFKAKLLNTVDQIYAINIDTLNYIPDKVITFARRQTAADAVLKMVDVIQNGEDLEICRHEMEKALQVGAGRDLGLDLQNSISDLPKLLELSSMDDSKKIPTGLPTLDTAMRGGLGCGHLGMLLGPSGRGKSLCLINLCVNALLHGKKVTYITFELSEVEVLVRVLMRLTGCTDEQVTKQTSDFKDKITTLGQKATRYLKIKYFAPGTITVGQLRAYLARLRCVEQWSPDLLILDDGDSFRIPNSKTGDTAATYYAQGETYTQIIALLNDFQAACWAATQATRAAYDLEVVTVANTAESFKKVHRAQAALALCQTKEEAVQNHARIFVAKGRGFRDGFFVNVQFEKHIMLMRERPSFASFSDEMDRGIRHLPPQTENDILEMVGQAPEVNPPE